MTTWLKKLSRLQIALGGVILLGIIWWLISSSSQTPPGLIKVVRGTVSQEVKVTGTTKPLQEVDLAFEQSGRIARTYVVVGSQVAAGQILASLDQGQLLAQLAEQEASVESEKATLQEMQKGARPEDVKIKEAALDTARQELENQYQVVPDILNEAYVKADDSIRKQLDALFTNDEETNVQLSFNTNNSQLTSDLESDRFMASGYLDAWKDELRSLSSASDRAVLENALNQASRRLSFFRDFLADLMTGVNSSFSLSSADATSYKTNITTARTNIASVLTNVTNAIQAIQTDKLAVKQSEANLNLTLAGNTPESIAAQSARVKQAEARVLATQAQIQKTILRAPFSGVITRQDAKAGEIASPNTPLVSLITRGKLEIESYVPEADIGKVSIDNPVSITIDAFPGETFSGVITYVDPAETIVDGVTNFKIAVRFDASDSRIKSGLTANLTILTKEKKDVLVIPLYAVTENASGSFVLKHEKDLNATTSITVGLRGQNGMAEIVSGLQENDLIVAP